MVCNNCSGPVDPEAVTPARDNCVTIKQGNVLIAIICDKCMRPVTLAKITLRRTDSGESFKYDQFQPVEAGKRFGG